MTRSIVIVVGAGASAEYGLPIGRAFRRHIQDAVNVRFDVVSGNNSGDSQLVEALRMQAYQEHGHHNINEYLPACAHIEAAVGQAASIDNFIDTHSVMKNLQMVGKMAIVRCILAAECNSRLCNTGDYIYIPFDIADTEGTWLHRFFELLITGTDLSGFRDRLASTALVIFNYDRCVEHYLHRAVQNQYQIDEVEATEVLSNFLTIHPYGQVGSLPWQGHGLEAEFGLSDCVREMKHLSLGIRTFTEQIDDDNLAKTLGALMANAERLVFLGFAYYVQNLQLLTSIGDRSIKRIYGTSFGMSEPNRAVAEERVASALLKHPNYSCQIVGLKAFDLLDQYSSELSY